MTKSRIRRVDRRSRGRPRKDDDDQIVVDLAAFFSVFSEYSGLGPQQARDLALTWKEGSERELTPKEREKLPRRFQRAGIVVRFELPVKKKGRKPVTYKGREGAIAEKLARGAIKPRPGVVCDLARLFAAAFSAVRPK